MVATLATSSLVIVASLTSESENKSSNKFLRPKKHVNTRDITFKANVQTPSQMVSTAPIITGDGDVAPILRASRVSSISPISNLCMLFGVMAKTFTKRTTKRSDDKSKLIDSFVSGKLVKKGLVFRQNFPIRSYEIGADGVVSLETLMNHCQETTLNHFKAIGILGDGLGSTPEMYKRKLIWVKTKVQIEIDCYPAWGDAVEVDSWMVSLRKNGMGQNSFIRNSKTGHVLVRATSNWVMINKETQKLCRTPDEVRAEIGPYMIEAPPIVENDNKKFLKLDKTTSDYVCTGLKPRWSDLDINQHVNNAKYFGWILESVPPNLLENQELSCITLEYKKECHRNNVIQSLTAVLDGRVDDSDDHSHIECQHLLRLEDGPELAKARTEWRTKHTNSSTSLVYLPKNNE